jgi:hypothetical protein
VWFLSLLARRRLAGPHTRPAGRKAPRAWLGIEALEDRTVPAFLAPVTYPGLVGSALVADVNNDHIPDLVAGANASAGVLLGNGDGTFQAPLTSASLFNDFAPLAVGDFNRDGNLDVVTPGSVHLGNGNGTFQPPQRLPLPSYFLARVALGTPTVCDLNNDGNLDLVGKYSVISTVPHGLQGGGGGTVTSTYLAWFAGKGDGSFYGPVNLPFGAAPLPYAPSTFAVADFNGDGALDILAGNGGSLTLHPGNGTGGFGATAVVANLPGAYGALQVADFNGDGKPDFLVVNPGSAGVSIFLNAGGGRFTDPQTFAIGSAASPQALGDFNQDGKLDLVTVDGVSGAISVLLGNGDGTLQPPQQFAGPPNATALEVADLDGDGFADLVAGSWNAAWVQRNDGNWPAPGTPAITISDVTVSEGNTGTTAAVFTVSLSAPSAQPVTVAYATADGTATAGSDYQAASGTVTFAPGETSKTITIWVNGDRAGEPNETFFVNLGPTGNAVLRDPQGGGAIVDDEPRITISDMTRNEGNGGRTAFTFTVTLSAAYDVPVTVHYATADGLATVADNDYLPTAGTLTFAPGQTTQTITVWVIGDKKKDSYQENFFVNLSGAVNALLADDQGVGWIVDDDF